MRTQRQDFLPGFQALRQKAFGGSLLKGNPRGARPLSFKRPLHLVLRSTHAHGPNSMLCARHEKKVKDLVHRLARQKGVRVYRFANSGNHLHLLIRARSGVAYKAYVRAFSGLIARLILGAERGRAKKLHFWDARPFSRIVEWGREYSTVCEYVGQNTLEALGFATFRKSSSANRYKPASEARLRSP